MGYTLKVLSNKEFDSLPYKRVHESLGLANPKDNTAYVRYSAVPELNKYLISHELDHLVEETPTDEFEGIRYKGFRDFASAALPMVGTAIGSAFGGPLGGTLGGAAGGALGGGIRKKSQGGGWGGALSGGAMGGLSSLFGGLGGFGKTGASAIGSSVGRSGGLLSGFGGGLRKAMPPMTSGFTGLGSMFSKRLAPAMGRLGSSLFSPTQGAIGGAVGNAKSAFSAAPTKSSGGGFLSSLFGGLGQGAKSLGGNVLQGAGSALGQGASDLGGALIGKLFGKAGSLFGLGGNQSLEAGQGYMSQAMDYPYPSVPPLPESINNLRSMIEAGGGSLGQLGKQRLTEGLNTGLQQMTSDEEAAILRQIEKDQMQAEDQVRDLYRNLRPGTDPSSDTSFRRDLQEVQERFAAVKSDALAQGRRQISQDFSNTRAQQIQQAIGADNATMEQLKQLALLDVEQIAAQLQIDLAQAQEFKQTFSSLGGNLILSGYNAQPSLLGSFGRGF